MAKEYPVKKYPIVGVCGLECGLCPRYHTSGTSRCPGCCGPRFAEKHPGCSRIKCCVTERRLETCAECPEWADCPRVVRILSTDVDSFISYKPLPASYAFIREHGIEQFVRRELEKLDVLKKLLAEYDDGRSKSFYCTACQLLPSDQLVKAVAATARTGAEVTAKEKASTMRAALVSLANELGIDLRLRK